MLLIHFKMSEFLRKYLISKINIWHHRVTHFADCSSSDSHMVHSRQHTHQRVDILKPMSLHSVHLITKVKFLVSAHNPFQKSWFLGWVLCGTLNISQFVYERCLMKDWSNIDKQNPWENPGNHTKTDTSRSSDDSYHRLGWDICWYHCDKCV